jgi:hypothetical protein
VRSLGYVPTETGQQLAGLPVLALRRRLRSWRRLSGWTKIGIVIGTVTQPLAVLLVRVVPFRVYRQLTTDRAGRPVDRRARDLARGLVIAGQKIGGTVVGNATSTAAGFHTLDLAKRTWPV